MEIKQPGWHLTLTEVVRITDVEVHFVTDSSRHHWRHHHRHDHHITISLGYSCSTTRLLIFFFLSHFFCATNNVLYAVPLAGNMCIFKSTAEYQKQVQTEISYLTVPKLRIITGSDNIFQGSLNYHRALGNFLRNCFSNVGKDDDHRHCKKYTIKEHCYSTQRSAFTMPTNFQKN